MLTDSVQCHVTGGDDPVIREAQRNMTNNRARWAAERGGAPCLLQLIGQRFQELTRLHATEMRLPPSASSYDGSADAPPPTPKAGIEPEGTAVGQKEQEAGDTANETATQHVPTKPGGT